MFCSMDEKLDDPAVRNLVNESAGDRSTEILDRKMADFRRREDFNLYGWVEDNAVLGVCGVEIHPDWVEIFNIAVDPSARKRGIGRAMVTAVQEKYKTTIKAETDVGAVEFYRKCGFETEGFMKTYSSGECQRYECVLHFTRSNGDCVSGS